MTAERVLDAMNELPDHLLEQTDLLRSRKPVRWQTWVAAACLVLVMGIAYSFLVAPAEKANDMVGDAGEDGMLEDKMESASTTGDWWIATVLTVEGDTVTVRTEFGSEREMQLTELEEKVDLQPGQRIRIYLKEAQMPTEGVLKPYRIKIEEE